MIEKLNFASDYMEGAHQAILDALVKTNMLSSPGYGADDFCKEAAKKILEASSCPNGDVYFLVGGTQTNATVIDCILNKYQGVIAADSGHIAVHEAGAIEYGGHKVLTVKGKDGKISAKQVQALVSDWEKDENSSHMVMPGMCYISQPTEYGTVYSLKELEALSAVCKKNSIPLFVDGARLAYALASSENDVELKDLARLADVFYIGGTKCGCLFGEAVVFPKKNFIPHFFTMIKQHGALLAKGRLLGVQFATLFTDNLYLKLGEPAISAAKKIEKKLVECGFKLFVPNQTNQVMFIIENDRLKKLSELCAYGFIEKFDERSSVIRFATAWSTTSEKTDKLLKVIEKI